MFKPSLSEPPSIVHALVETNDSANIVMSEVWEVELGGMKGIAVVDSTLVMRTSKRKELS